MAQGDFCNTAVAVTAGVHNANGPSSGTGASNICPGGFGTNADWYTFTAPTDSDLPGNELRSLLDDVREALDEQEQGRPGHDRKAGDVESSGGE